MIVAAKMLDNFFGVILIDFFIIILVSNANKYRRRGRD